MLFPTLSIPDISFSLEPLCKILQRNQSITKLQNYKVLQLQKEKHNCTLIGHSVVTIIADKLMDIGVNVQKHTSHSWRDFSFTTFPITQKWFFSIV